MFVKVTSELKSVFSCLLDFVIPPLCISCEKHLDKNNRYLCDDCYKLLESNKHKSGFSYSVNGRKVVTMFIFSEESIIQKLIHALKYEKMSGTGIFLGRMLGEILTDTVAHSFDIIVPVPLHFSKKRERSFNQSDSIAKGITEILGIPFLPHCLIRTRYTQSQTKLNVHERKTNVAGAFRINNKFINAVSGKKVLLVDDVITTAATILECAETLISAGSVQVTLCSVAKA